MKKGMLLFVAILFTASTAQAAVSGPDAARAAHREEMKAIKKAQRERGEKPKIGFRIGSEEFWKKEGERSGFSQMGQNNANFVQKLNPVPFFKDQSKRYNERKEAARAAALK